MWVKCLAVVICVFGVIGPASAKSLLGNALISGPRGALISPGGVSDAARAAGTASLFSGRAGRSLFAPVVRASPEILPDAKRHGTMGLLDLIAGAEAGSAGYDAVVYSARIKTPRRPTDMTVQEIYKWIDDTPGQNHAIGRYQFIPTTLRYLMKRTGSNPEERFSPALQNRLAAVLLEDAGQGDFLAGKLGQTGFMNNLAKIWAGLPTSSGRSYYEGIAGNKAVLTWARYEAEVTRIFRG